MAWQTITDRNDGDAFSGADYQEVQDAITELQGVVGTDETVENALVEAGDYTPTLTNINVGDGTNAANYVFIGFDSSADIGILAMSGQIALGTGSSMAAGAVAPPSGFELDTDVTNSGIMIVGQWGCNDSGTLYMGGMAVLTSTTVGMRAWDSSASYLRNVAVSSTVPMTWTSGDSIRWHAICRVVRT